jgi:hypothetical protein
MLIIDWVKIKSIKKYELKKNEKLSFLELNTKRPYEVKADPLRNKKYVTVVVQ